MKPDLRTWGEAVADVLFPPQCVACAAIGQEPFCPLCETTLESAPRLRLDDLDAAAAVWTFEGAVVRAVHRLKYDRRFEIARPLGRALRPLVGRYSADLIVPIPLAPTRLRERGFNQARELSRALAPGAPRIVLRALRRRRHSASQVGRSQAERRTAIDVFSAESRWVAGRKILLIDDVVTTGATAASASRALRAAGASGVALITVAATPLRIRPVESPL